MGWELGSRVWEKQKSLIALFAWPSYYFTLCFSVARLLSTTTTCPLLMSRARMIECWCFSNHCLCISNLLCFLCWFFAFYSATRTGTLITHSSEGWWSIAVWTVKLTWHHKSIVYDRQETLEELHTLTRLWSDQWLEEYVATQDNLHLRYIIASTSIDSADVFDVYSTGVPTYTWTAELEWSQNAHPPISDDTKSVHL